MALTNVVGFDDGPFERTHRGDVTIYGVVCAGTRMDGLLTGRVRRDGANATDTVARLVRGRFDGHVRAVLLHGIAVAGFNVVDLHALAERLERPVLVVCRRLPDLDRIARVLHEKVPGGTRKWRLIEKAGPMEPLGPLWIQRAGLDLPTAAALVAGTTLQGNLPEALRLAHLIGAGTATGASRGRA